MAKDQEERELWEQQPNEPPVAFARFAFYRDMRYPKAQDGADVTDGSIPYEKRSLRRVAAHYNVNPRTIMRQCEVGEWVKRCEAYDRHVDSVNRAANEAAIVKMKSDHALLAQQMIRKATKRLLTIPEDQIGAAELVRMVDVAVKVERLSRGESTENQAVTHDGQVEVKQDAGLDLTNLSDEELDQFEQLLAKIHGATGS